jgi:hypothetical protein
MPGNFFYAGVTAEELNTIPVPFNSIPTGSTFNVSSYQQIDTLVDKLVILAPPDESIQDQILLNTKLLMWERIKEYRTIKSLNSGVFCNGKWFNTDVISRTQYERYYTKAMALLATDNTATDATVLSTSIGPTYWKTMDNSFIPMTIGLIKLLMPAIENREAEVFYQAEVHRTLLWNSTDPANYDFSTGWPISFGDT